MSKRNKMETKTDLEVIAAERGLLSIDDYAAELRVQRGLKTSSTGIRKIISKIERGLWTVEEAGFRPHFIAKRWVIEPLSVKTTGS